MKRWQLGLATTVTLAISGCASSGPSDSATNTLPPEDVGMTMANGMTMGPGESMPGMTNPADPSSDGGKSDLPSDAARLVCGTEIARNIEKLAALTATPEGTATWADGLYTCTYQLPAGPLVLSVKDSTDLSVGRTYFASLRNRLGDTRPLHGLEALGLPAYETRDGEAVFLKDGKTLLVDATELTEDVGPHEAGPAEVAYEIATDVIGCWSEDE
jgi:hypothetical protein